MYLADNFNNVIERSENKFTLLIVDDDPDIVVSLCDLFELEEISVKVITAGSESEARAIAGSESIDIALLDIRLGTRNGLDLVPLLKQKNKHVVCLMMTAYRDVKYAVNAIRFGADDYLYKPLEPSHLLSVVKRNIKYQDYRKQRDRAESWFHTIFQTSDQYLLIGDLKGNIVQINDQAAEFCQIDKKAAIGRKIWDLSPWSENERSAAKLRNAYMAADQNSRSSVEVTVKVPNLINATFELSIRPILESDGNAGYLLLEGQDITLRKEKEDFLKRRAYHDELTGLPNRTSLVNSLANQTSVGARRNKKFSILFIDLDNFKQVNDTYGHNGGDQVLKQIAERLIRCVRDEDMVGRYSGDEFIAVLNETEDKLHSESVAERVRKELSADIRIDEHSVSISCSIGIALYPQHGRNPEELIQKADEAMYLAKCGGKDRYKVSD